MPYKFYKASDVLSKLMKDYGLTAKTHEYKILKTWDNTVGEKISSHARPLRLIRGSLTVIVDSPAWIHQLTFYKEDIINKINNEIGKSVVREIRFKVGKVEGKETVIVKTQDSGIKAEIQAIESKVERYLEPVKDPEVRKVIKGVITKAMTMPKKTVP